MKHVLKYLKPKTYLNYLQFKFSKQTKYSWAQQGEDILIEAALRSCALTHTPNYLDVGANHPIRGNNTYYFYRKGCRGVCIEPDPELFKVLQRYRRKDTLLNIGIGTDEVADAEYFVMSLKPLSTFKRTEAEQYVAQSKYGSQKIEKVLHIPLRPVNAILAEYFSNGLDILSIDTEGFDLDILRSLDFSKYKPRVICVETWRYNPSGALVKVTEMEELLLSHGYSIFADTHTNTIFLSGKGDSQKK